MGHHGILSDISDPVFQTRAELEAWAERAWGRLLTTGPGTFTGLDVVEEIDRITAAHAHLLENDDANG